MPAHLLPSSVDWSLVRREFAELQRRLAQEGETSPGSLASFDSILDGSYEKPKSDSGDEDKASAQSTVSEKIGRAQAYADRLDATSVSCPAGHAFVNGKHYDLDDVSPCH